MPLKPFAFEITEKEAGKSLLQVIKGRFPHLSSRQIKTLLEHRACKVNGHIERFSSRKVFLKEKIEFKEENTAPILGEKELMLFESNNEYIVNKPPSIAMPKSTRNEFLGLKPIYLVHRLDKETSGALALAKTVDAQSKWEEAFKKKQVEKAYLAICDGKFPQKEQIVQIGIRPEKKITGQTIYIADPKIEANAKTFFWGMERGKESGKDASLVLCFPKTGRTHQLRVHLSYLGHPILGDRQYAKHFRTLWTPKRILLHSFYLKAPWQKKGVFAPIPKDFFQALQILGIAYTLKHLEEKVLECGY